MHTFKNFKNFADVEIDLSKPMTLLIGRNGSGKSNLVEGVELLSELIKGRLIEEISDLNRGNKFEIRGNLKGCVKKGTKAFEIGFKGKEKIKDEIQNIEYKVKLELIPSIDITRIVLNNDEVIFSTKYSELQKDYLKLVGMGLGVLAGGVIGAYMGWGLGVLANKNMPNSEESILYQYFETHVFDIHPHLMRNYEDRFQKKLVKNGSNISSILYYLQKTEPKTLKRILKYIQQFPEEVIIDFEFITTPSDEVIFALKYKNGLVIDAKLLSDGTLRALAILTALETVPEGSRVIIEEIDNGIHASRTKVLLDAIWETSHRRNLKTLITTHNSATLDGLNDEQLEGVVICHYDKETQSAKLTPLFNLPQVYELLERGHLGSIVAKNYIEQHLDPSFEEERKRIALEWLESME